MVFSLIIINVDGVSDYLKCPDHYSRHPHRDKNLTEFLNTPYGTIIATNSLTEGIDLLNIHFIIHLGLPFQFMDYVQ